MKTLKFSAALSLALLGSMASASTCVELGAISKFFSINPVYNIRYNRYARLIHQAEESKGFLFKHAVKRIQKACPSKTESEIRDMLIMGDANGSFCTNESSPDEIPFFNSADVMSVHKVIKTVREECREPSFLESLDFDE